MNAEFSRPVSIDTIGSAKRTVSIEADTAERAALAERFGLAAIDSLSADVTLSREDGPIAATGTVRADVVQTCIASGLPVPAHVEEVFAIAFHPQSERGGEEEIELDAGDMDVVFYEGGAIDIGEAVSETLSLALDPYPRAPGADAALREAGVRREADVKAERRAEAEARSPFAVLRKN